MTTGAASGSLSFAQLQDLSSFPQWTLDAHIISRQPESDALALIGLSNNSLAAFRCPSEAGRLASKQAPQPLWTASCSEELLLYSIALHAEKVCSGTESFAAGHRELC